ncbi:MAG: response regulator, partial [Thiotrichaceae bacterium]|nr:response regulator [Thiotrichaceae bacterium]
MIDIAENLFKPLILIAEDDDITRAIAVKTFENLGYRVITASDGQQAIDICYAERPQVILMDGSMPGIDGFGACQQIKKAIDESIRNIPIIIITALESDEAIDKAFSAGAEDYITKPVNWHILEHRLDVLIKKVQAEKSLRQSEERFHTIFNEAPLGLAVIDSLTGRIYDVNPAYMRIVGRTAEELKTI